MESVVERDAGIRLKSEHDKLIAKLGTFGGCLTILLFIVLLVIADSMGRAAGGGFIGLFALAVAAAFVSSFLPQFRPKFAKALLSKRLIDPLSGQPLRMVWWFRWFTASLAILLLIGLADYVAPPSQNTPSQSTGAESAASQLTLTAEQTRDARLVLCDAVEDEMDDVNKGQHAKNALVLADQMRPGGRVVGLRAIKQEYAAYLAGQWREADCTPLYAAASAAYEFGDGHTMKLPEGAIQRGVEFNAASFETDKELAGPELPE